MLKRTHLAIGIAVALYFVPFVNYQYIFLPVVLIASILPDLGSFFSDIRANRLFKKSNIERSNGILHTYTFAVLTSLFLALFFPIFALPFFLGYSFHLLADSFTVKGIRPFWPLKTNSTGRVKTGGPIDRALFVTFVIIDIVLLIGLAFN